MHSQGMFDLDKALPLNLKHIIWMWENRSSYWFGENIWLYFDNLKRQFPNSYWGLSAAINVTLQIRKVHKLKMHIA